MNLWIITVNFGNTSVTESLIDSLSVIENINSIKIGIADNAASSESISKLNHITKKTKLDITIFPNKKNIYYWPAAKQAINNLKNMLGSFPDWVIVCNNDITFTNSSFFNQLEKIDIKKFPIVGPKIINPHGQDLNPFMVSSLSIFQKFYWDLYFTSYSIAKILLVMKKLVSFFSSRKKSENLLNKKEVYAVHGSAILFSNYFFQKGGSLDDNFDMYGEELTVAGIAKKLNFPVTYIPQLEVYHHEHKSTRMIDQKYLYNKARKSHKYFQSAYPK